MLPAKKKIKDAHFKMDTPPSSRSEMQPHCPGLRAVCSQLGNDDDDTGSSVAGVASTKTDFLQSFGELP